MKGSPRVPRAKRSVADRFWSHVDQTAPDGHWLWTAYVNPKGYGYFQTEDGIAPTQAHRVAWTLAGLDLPSAHDGMLANACGVKHCVRPDHHEVISHSVSRRRAWARRKGTQTNV